jgi:hypothetical protein
VPTNLDIYVYITITGIKYNVNQTLTSGSQTVIVNEDFIALSDKI